VAIDFGEPVEGIDGSALTIHHFTASGADYKKSNLVADDFQAREVLFVRLR
jgi:hypothetical protein